MAMYRLIYDPDCTEQPDGWLLARTPEAFMLLALSDEIGVVAVNGDGKELPDGRQVLSWLLKERLYSGKRVPKLYYLWARRKAKRLRMRRMVERAMPYDVVIAERKPY